jgi:hypothetical protein
VGGTFFGEMSYGVKSRNVIPAHAGFQPWVDGLDPGVRPGDRLVVFISLARKDRFAIPASAAMKRSPLLPRNDDSVPALYFRTATP